MEKTKVLVVYAKEENIDINILGQEISIPTTKILNEVLNLNTDIIDEKAIEDIEEFLKNKEYGWNFYVINIIKLTTK